MTEFNPDYATHPGEVVKEYIEYHNMSVEDCANAIGQAVEKMEGVFNGTEVIDPFMAFDIETQFGISAVVLNNMQDRYNKFYKEGI